MNTFNIFSGLIIAFGVYKCFTIKEDYEDYTKDMSDSYSFIKGVGLIIGAIMLLIFHVIMFFKWVFFS